MILIHIEDKKKRKIETIIDHDRSIFWIKRVSELVWLTVPWMASSVNQALFSN